MMRPARALLSTLKPKTQVVFILGGPCSGKGTQSQMIQDRMGYKHLSAGELLRQQRNNPHSNYGDLIESTIVSGKIVPSFITVALLDKAMQAHRQQYSKYLVDGFPRNMENLLQWNNSMGEQVLTPFIVFLSCSEATMIDRLRQRSKTSSRSDDNIEVMKKRFKTFNQDTMQVVNWFRKDDRVIEVSAESTAEQIYTQISTQINKRLN